MFLNHTIVREGHRDTETVSDVIKARMWRRDAFIHRYIFPDGRLVPAARVIECAEHAGLELRDVEALREHYVLTLRHWLGALEAHEKRGDSARRRQAISNVASVHARRDQRLPLGQHQHCPDGAGKAGT